MALDDLSASNRFLQPLLEEAVANGLNFQNLDRICEAFKTIEIKLDVASTLRRPFRRRKQSSYDSLRAIIERRHRFVHKNEVDIQYLAKDVERDIEDLKVAMERVYKKVTALYSWEFVKTWGA